MKRTVRVVLAIVFLAVVLLPPWRVTWRSDSKDPSPLSLEETWAGFRPWTYSSERPTSVIAWDGPNTGGRVSVTGEPRIVYGTWTILLLIAGTALYLVMRTRRPTEKSHGD
jgi:hypothetical protein